MTAKLVNATSVPSHPQNEVAADRLAALRIVDANLNRASEGLRVMEEYCRFGLDDRHLTQRCKDARHQLAILMSDVSVHDLAVARETEHDVGVSVSTDDELTRSSPLHIFEASCKRVQQSLRALEEYGKLLQLAAAAEFEALRYRAYTLEKAVVSTLHHQRALDGASLYVLMDGAETLDVFAARARAIASAGVHILQLRDKQLGDRDLVERARLLRKIAHEERAAREQSGGFGPLFIMNDRPDLAVLAQADGVHMGQQELRVKDVRQIVGPGMLIGVSTHSMDQARAAVLDGASYIGCGPTFPSGTKKFESFPGLPFLRQVAAEVSLPAFAIGGITRDNLPQVLATGIRRVAVSGAISSATKPVEEVKSILAMLPGSS